MTNVGMIGLGGRGMGLMRVLLLMKDVRVSAVCDVYKDRTDKAAKEVKIKNKKAPFITDDYKELIKRDDVDIVLISASWEMHVEMASESMRAGKFTAMEVGGSYDIEECNKLIAVYEETKTPFMFLENCCYGERELMCKNLAEQGKFGKIVQLDGAYCHDIRNEIAFGKENRHYRLNHYIHHNCDNYPTHDIGPIAKILNIGNGNSFKRLCSFSTRSEGLHQYILDKKKDDTELLNTNFAQGDIITTLIECENGEIIRLTLETTLPIAYSRQFTVHGTKGSYREDGDVLILDDEISALHRQYAEGSPRKLYCNTKKYEKKYGHDLWKKRSFAMRVSGHGGMDYLVLRAMVESCANKTPSPIDVYDAAEWMCITALSEQSLKNDSAWVEFPNFRK